MTIQTDPIPRERLRCLAARIRDLGPRPTFELLNDLQSGRPFGETVERYAELWPLASFIAAHGGRDLPPARLVARRRG